MFSVFVLFCLLFSQLGVGLDSSGGSGSGGGGSNVVVLDGDLNLHSGLNRDGSLKQTKKMVSA